MSRAKVRSFPVFLLAALVLLMLSVSAVWAEEKKGEESANTQEQAAPAADAQTQEQPASEPAAKRKPQVPAGQEKQGAPAQARPSPSAPGSKQGQPAAGPPAWQRTPLPARPRPGGPAPTAGRNDRANPYERYRAQAQERPTTPERTPPGYRAQPYQSPARESDAPSQVTPSNRWQQAAPGRRATPEKPSVVRERPQPSLPDKVKERARPQERSPVVAPKQEGRRLTVPQATFRGPEADKRVNNIPAERASQLQLRLRNQVRTVNRVEAQPKTGRITRDVVGNLVPKDARLIQRNNVSRIKLGATRIETLLGHPTYYYSFIPRYPSDYYEGYWEGYRDGYWDGRRHVPHGAVVINFYYGYYWSDPYWFGFYYPGYYPSIYHYIGFCPGWVYPTRVYYTPVEYVYLPLTPYRYYAPSSALDERGAERAISDIRRAWFDNDIDRIASHLTDELDIQVYFDGEYSYTTSTEDYYAMTADALSTTSTVDLDFDHPIFISSHEVFYTGRHVFFDPDGYRQTVYVSYRLRHLGVHWYLVAVGTSLSSIQHQYHDFRYD